MIEFEMDGILAISNVAIILGLEFVCSLTNNLGDFVRAFIGRTQLAGSWVFGVLVDSAQHPVSNFESLSSDVLVVVPCHLLLVGCSLKTNCVSQLINGVKVVVKLLQVGILV